MKSMPCDRAQSVTVPPYLSRLGVVTAGSDMVDVGLPRVLPERSLPLSCPSDGGIESSTEFIRRFRCNATDSPKCFKLLAVGVTRMLSGNPLSIFLTMSVFSLRNGIAPQLWGARGFVGPALGVVGGGTGPYGIFNTVVCCFSTVSAKKYRNVRRDPARLTMLNGGW